MVDQASVTSGLLLLVASFLATGVEMVEALTIILATGITRGWRSTFIGAGSAAVILGAVIAVFGLTLTSTLPLWALRVVVGTFLLIFGLQWLRKAVLRSGGVIAYRDEAKAFSKEVQVLRGEAVASGSLDWTAFVIAFKGVLLEGLEAAFIVITFGLSARATSLAGFSGVGLAAVGAAAAMVAVAIAGVALHRPLSMVPENTMKFAVGLLLTAFGTFWAAEGIGIEWPLEDLTILLLLAFYILASWSLVALLRYSRQTVQAARGGGH